MKKIILTLIVILTIFSCGQKNTKNTLVLNLGSEGQTLDTSKIATGSSQSVQALLSEGLVKIGKDGNLVPGLAKLITISKDGLVYDVVLRDNIKWSNGKPITSKDFKYAWQRELNPKTGSVYSYLLYTIKNGEAFNNDKVKASDLGIEIINDKHFKVYLENVTPYFDVLLTLPWYLPINQEFVESQGNNYALEKENLLYSGAYVIKKWVHGESILLEKNPNYYDKDNIHINNILIKYISNSSSALNAFKNDEIDETSLTAEQYDEFKNKNNIVKVKEATDGFLLVNSKNQYLKNKNIRKAIQLAINREELVKSVFDNLTATPLYSLTPAGVGVKGNKKDFVEELFEAGYNPNKYDVEKAKEYLALGLQQLGLKKLPPISLLFSNQGASDKIVEFVQEQLRKNLGITIKVEAMSYKERIARMLDGDFELVYATWGANYLDPTDYLNLVYVKSGNNLCKYDIPEYNKLLDLAYKEPNKEKRTKLLIDAEKVLSDEVPFIYLIQPQKIYAYNPQIENLIFPSFGQAFVVNYAKIK